MRSCGQIVFASLNVFASLIVFDCFFFVCLISSLLIFFVRFFVWFLFVCLFLFCLFLFVLVCSCLFLFVLVCSFFCSYFSSLFSHYLFLFVCMLRDWTNYLFVWLFAGVIWLRVFSPFPPNRSNPFNHLLTHSLTHSLIFCCEFPVCVRACVCMFVIVWEGELN